jgi:putative ABC transport system ATP-binding protein
MNDRPVVVTEGLGREFEAGGHTVPALRDVDLRLPREELTVVHGRSGSGKTTLLNMIGGLDRPTHGRVWLDGDEVSAKDEDALVELRREKIGFVFQAFGLVPILTAAENVEVPLRLRKVDPTERDRRVRELLDLVGLAGRAGHRPYELSGGEQQRVAICRALANRPELLIADEPTASSTRPTPSRSWSSSASSWRARACRRSRPRTTRCSWTSRTSSSSSATAA